MKKVLIVTPGYYPAKTYGGPVVSIKNLTDSLGNELDFYILTSNHELKDTAPIEGLPKGFVRRGGATVCYLSDDEMTNDYFEKILDELQPDCIYINAIYHRRMALPMIQLAKNKNIRCVIAPRGGLCGNAMEFSKYKKLLYLKVFRFLLGKNVCFQSTSDEESLAIRKYFGERIELVELTNLPKSMNENTEEYRVPKSVGEVRMIFFSRIHPKKNLKFALEILGEVQCNSILDIYGPIENTQYWDECKKIIDTLPAHIHVNYCGYLNNEDITKTLGKYDLFFFPTLSENFGHVIAEALSEKCNILISNNTPWTDVNTYAFGKAFALENIDSFRDYIDSVARLSEKEIQAQRESISTYWDVHFDFTVLKRKYVDMFESINED